MNFDNKQTSFCFTNLTSVFAAPIQLPLGGSKQELPTFIDFFAVRKDLAAMLHVGYHVPVDGRFVLTARLQVRLANGHVYRAAYLLIEEDVFGETVNFVIRSNSRLAKTPGSR